MKNLNGLMPALKALANIGPQLSQALIFATAFPYGPAFADKISKGDYINLLATFDLTYPRLKRSMLLGTRWGDEDAKLIPAPGDPYFMNYAYDPIMVGVAPPPTEAAVITPSSPGAPSPLFGPVLPVLPPPPARPQFGPAPVLQESQIFAGPYGAEASPPPPAAPPEPAAPAPGGGG